MSSDSRGSTDNSLDNSFDASLNFSTSDSSPQKARHSFMDSGVDSTGSPDVGILGNFGIDSSSPQGHPGIGSSTHWPDGMEGSGKGSYAIPHSSTSMNEDKEREGSPTESDMKQDPEVHSTDTLGHTKAGFKPLKDKQCLVCGDKALGYNFNAVSCESCKAFFRRNATKDVRGRCEGRCEITVESRSYCKKCRLRKCFEVGMKKDMILSDRQKQVRKQKIQQNRCRKMGLPLEEPMDTQEGSESGGSSDGMTIKQEVPKTHVIAAEVSEESLANLDPHTRERIEDVMKAFKASFDCPMNSDPINNPSNTDFLNMADTSVRRLVKMAKQLSQFRQLDQDDQISLLKGAVVEVLILRSSKMFDSNSMGWSVNRGGTQQVVSAAALQFGNKESIDFFKQYHRFASSLLASTQNDNIILMLLIVIAVLSPDRPSLKMRDTISKAQEDYTKVLDSYIRERYPGQPLILPKALQKLADIRELNETHTKMLLHMRIEELEPLVVEIFDLSS